MGASFAAALGFAFLCAGPAYAGGPVGGQLLLDGSGTWQSHDLETNWLREHEEGLREELRATFDGYLLDRSLASYKLGVALNNRAIMGEDRSSSQFGYTYDGKVTAWKHGAVPVVVYGSHLTSIPQLEQAPSDRTTSDTYGYQASLALKTLPKLDSSGRYQAIEWMQDGERHREVLSDLNFGIFQVTKSNHARALVERETQRGPTEGTSRDVRRASVDVASRVTDRVEVVARADAREYTTAADDEVSSVGNTDSDALIRYELDGGTTGMTYLQQHRSVLNDSRYDGVAVGSELARAFAGGAYASGSVGATYDTTEEENDVSRFVGEFARTAVGASRMTAFGTYEGGVTTGVAHFSELGVDGGLQGGASVKGSVSRGLFDFFRLHVGGDVRGQADSSTLDQDFAGYGWRGGLSTRRAFGFVLAADVTSNSIRQLSRAEGNSDQLRASAVSRLQMGSLATLQYTMTHDRLMLDGEFSRGLGHSLRVDIKATRTVTLSALAYQNTWETSEFAPSEWWRAEGLVTWRLFGFTIDGRASRDYARVGDEARASTNVLVTLSRRFAWRI